MRKLIYCKHCGNNDPKLCSATMMLATQPIVEVDDEGKPVVKDGRIKLRTDPIHGFPLKQVAGVYYKVKCLKCRGEFKANDRCFLRCLRGDSDPQPDVTKTPTQRTIGMRK